MTLGYGDVFFYFTPAGDQEELLDLHLKRTGCRNAAMYELARLEMVLDEDESSLHALFVTIFTIGCWHSPVLRCLRS